jgi:hypothetical protein
MNHILRFGQKRKRLHVEQNDDEWHTNGLVTSWWLLPHRAVLLNSGQLADGRDGLCSCRLRYCAAQADSSSRVSQVSSSYNQSA